MKALCVRIAGGADQDSWLTLNHEYRVLSILMTSKGPAKLGIIADDGTTPILADASEFAVCPQPPPPSWVLEIREDGVVELGPRPGWNRDSGSVDGPFVFSARSRGTTGGDHRVYRISCLENVRCALYLRLRLARPAHTFFRGFC